MEKNQVPTMVEDAARPPNTSILVSSYDQKIVILDDGKIVASGAATITDPSTPLGNHVFILSYMDTIKKQLRWQTIGYYDNAQRSPEATETDTIARIKADHAIVEAIRSRMHPGTTLVTVDLPLSPDTRTGKDFVIMSDNTPVS